LTERLLDARYCGTAVTGRDIPAVIRDEILQAQEIEANRY
jgi:hypothetical protein